MRKAVGGENGRAVDAAIPKTMHSSARAMGPGRMRLTMKILHMVAVGARQGKTRVKRHSSEKGGHSASGVSEKKKE